MEYEVIDLLDEEQSELEKLDLDPDDELICNLLSQGWTHTQTANEVGCSTKTIQRRMADPAFEAEVRRRRKAEVNATTARLVQLGRSATDQLSRPLSSENERVCLQAARTVLDLGHRRHRAEAVEDDLSERVEVLEGLLARLHSDAGEKWL